MAALLNDRTTNIMLVGPDSTVLEAVSRLLALDPKLNVAAKVASIDEAPLESTPADVVIVDQPGASPRMNRSLSDAVYSRSPMSTVAILDSLKSLSVGEFLGVVRALGSHQPIPSRHLRPVPQIETESDMRMLLSDRELEVVRLVAEGISNRDISHRLGLSDKTVKNHISHILAKLGLTARTQVAVHAIRTGLV